MSLETIKKLILLSNMYFWGTEDIDVVSMSWYLIFALGSIFSLVVLILVSLN